MVSPLVPIHPLKPLAVAFPLALALACGLACGASETQVYSVRGRVVALEDGGRELVVDHEEVPGFMPAMQMSLPVQDAEETAELSPGDLIRFDFYVSRGTGSVGSIEPLPADTVLELASPR